MSVYGKNCVSGKWTPKNPEKYRGDLTAIFGRSSWEFRFFNFCDLNPDVLAWASEEIVIQYFDPTKHKMRRYFVDFWIQVRQKDGAIKKYLIEIKPEKFTRPPEQPKRKTKRYVEEVMQYLTNTAKWEAATKVCKDNDMEFIILTESHLGIKK